MNSKNQYLLMFTGKEWYNHLSSAEIQEVIERSRAWFERLAASGKIKGSHALARDGATITGASGRVVSDGPFAESKEAVGGFLVLEAGSLEEVIAIARENPAVAHGTTIEIRPLTDECPLDVRARTLASEAQLTEAIA